MLYKPLRAYCVVASYPLLDIKVVGTDQCLARETCYVSNLMSGICRFRRRLWVSLSQNMLPSIEMTIVMDRTNFRMRRLSLHAADHQATPTTWSIRTMSGQKSTPCYDSKVAWRDPRVAPRALFVGVRRRLKHTNHCLLRLYHPHQSIQTRTDI